jgi:hypothetical protein
VGGGGGSGEAKSNESKKRGYPYFFLLYEIVVHSLFKRNTTACVVDKKNCVTR